MDLTFRHPSRISGPVFASVLAARNSPAATAAQSLYIIPQRYGLDPAVALAFFWHETKLGTIGRNLAGRNWGEIRIPHRRAPWGKALNPNERGALARYASYDDSLDAWCQLITEVYIPRGLDTVRKALPVYAPSSDNNNPSSYANTVISLVRRWQQQSGDVADPWAAWGTAYPLPEAERNFAIPQAWLRDGRLGAAQSPVMYADGGAFAARWFAGGVVVWERDGDRVTVVRV